MGNVFFTKTEMLELARSERMAIVFGMLVGVILGLTGAGGSMLAVPILMWGTGWPLAQAAPVVLVGVCVASALGTVFAWDVTYIRYRAAVLLALASFVTAPLGFWVARRMSADALAGVFAVMLVLVASRLFAQQLQQSREMVRLAAPVAGGCDRSSRRWCRLNRETGRIAWTRSSVAGMAVIGAAAGFFSALLGVGGGFVIVPSLRTFSELSMHSVVATSLMAISLISATTVGIALIGGVSVPWKMAVPFAAGALAGTFIGRRMALRVSGARLQLSLTALMFLTGSGMLARAAHLL